MTWTTETGTAYQDYIYNDDTVSNVVNSYNAANGRYGQVFSAVILNSQYADFDMIVVLISETGVEMVLPQA